MIVFSVLINILWALTIVWTKLPSRRGSFGLNQKLLGTAISLNLWTFTFTSPKGKHTKKVQKTHTTVKEHSNSPPNAECTFFKIDTNKIKNKNKECSDFKNKENCNCIYIFLNKDPGGQGLFSYPGPVHRHGGSLVKFTWSTSSYAFPKKV